MNYHPVILNEAERSEESASLGALYKQILRLRLRMTKTN
jgi:hypothetical protein